MSNRLLNIADLALIQELQLQVAEEVGIKTYIPIKDSIVQESLVRGMIFGSFLKDRLIAVCIGFSQKEDILIFNKILPKINLEQGFIRLAYVVSIEAREAGLIKILLKECLMAARRLGLNHALATVSPMNGKSIKILLDSGFQIVNVSEEHFGSLRYATYLDLNNIQLEIKSDIWIESTDIEQQSKLIERGFVGIMARKSDSGSTLIAYQQF